MALSPHLGTAAAPQTGPERWRSLARLPQVNIECKFEFLSSRGVVLQGDQYAWPDEIKSLEKETKTAPADPEKLLRLARLYAWTGADAKSTQTAARVTSLLRKRLEAQPNHGPLYTRLGQVLAGSGQWAEAEAALRRGTVLAPEASASWQALGEFLSGRAVQALFASTNGLDSISALAREFLHAEQPRRIAAEHLVQARSLMAEAERCLDRAVTLGAQQSEPYFARVFARGNRRLIEFLATWDGNREQAAFMLTSFAFTPEGVTDFKEAARWSPKDPRLVGGLALFEAWAVATQAGPRGLEELTSEDWWRRLPETNQVSIRSAISRLEALGDDPNPKIAGGALEMLAAIRFMIFRDLDSGEKAARRAVALDPTREQAWELLVLGPVLQERWEDLRRVTEDRLKARRSARNHILAAKANERLKNWKVAEQHVDAALAQAPDDPIPQLAKAVLGLKRGTEEGLAQAGKHLKKAQELAAAAPSPQTSRGLILTMALYAALRGETAEARQLVELVLKSDADDEDAKAILESLPR
jgi:tetratricopeptide (TPR) repeat protein